MQKSRVTVREDLLSVLDKGSVLEMSSKRRRGRNPRPRLVKSHVILIILDGWGIAPKSQYNAISLARTPNFDLISQEFGSIPICASGNCVGLKDGQMGNSEVGHLTIGAGRIIFQDLMRVSQEIESGRLARNKDLTSALHRAAKAGGPTLHLVGLVSDGGVHSHINHLFALLKIAKDKDAKNVAVHVILDGRDTPPKSGIEFVRSLESYMKSLGTGFIATVSGRFYAMDRDNRWERTKLAYDAMIHGQGEHYDQALTAISASYQKGVTDEFLVPCVMDSYQGARDADVVFFFNFRPDRARQLTKSFVLDDKSFHFFDRGKIPRKLEVLTMTIYDERLSVAHAILGRERVLNTLSKILEKNKIRQLRIAETEKYAHVTYFFNGLNERPLRLEERVLAPSAKEVGTYDKKPEMSAKEITVKAISSMLSQKYGFILINFANADMVGHSGNIGATVRAVEVVDLCLGRILNAWNDLETSRKPSILITGDHGNAEKMFDPETGQPHTAHTSNPVPLILISEKWKISLPSISYQPGLVDLAPSILQILGLKRPSAMTGISLVYPGE